MSGLAADDPRHGSATAYKYGCRCATCRSGNTERMREYLNDPKAREASRKRNRCSQRAARRLVAAYRDEYEQYYALELALDAARKKEGAWSPTTSPPSA